MFRLYTEANPKVIPCLHYPVDAVTTYSLHCLGQKLSPSVRLRAELIVCVYVTFDRQLFGEDEDGGAELDEAEKQGENGRHLS